MGVQIFIEVQYECMIKTIKTTVDFKAHKIDAFNSYLKKGDFRRVPQGVQHVYLICHKMRTVVNIIHQLASKARHNLSQYSTASKTRRQIECHKSNGSCNKLAEVPYLPTLFINKASKHDFRSGSTQ